MRRHFSIQCLMFLICTLLPFARLSFAQSNQILGEIELVSPSKVEKTSGVRVDGQYLGYLKELKGSKKILLLPGEHEIVVRQDGYQDFTDKITVRPGGKHAISVRMVKDPRFKIAVSLFRDQTFCHSRSGRGVCRRPIRWPCWGVRRRCKKLAGGAWAPQNHDQFTWLSNL
jgi:PEGA domain